jgi:hypothetical protein
MRIYVAMLALFPIFAAAQGLSTLEITSGTDVAFGGVPSATNGELYGNGFSGYLYAGPELISYPPVTLFYGGPASFSFCFGCGLPGTDDGVGSFGVTPSSDSPLAGLVQTFGPNGDVETGEVTVAPIDVTGAGTYSAPFAMSAVLAFGPTYTAPPTDYVDYVGMGTLTLDVGPATCYSQGYCGPLQIESVTYTFAPELDPAPLTGALTLLAGGLLVLRGRRSHAPANR